MEAGLRPIVARRHAALGIGNMLSKRFTEAAEEFAKVRELPVLVELLGLSCQPQMLQDRCDPLSEKKQDSGLSVKGRPGFTPTLAAPSGCSGPRLGLCL